MKNGWTKVRGAASYAGVSEHTLREWIRQGLKCSHLPTGLTLLKYSWIDEFLENFATSVSEIDSIINDLKRCI